jgi:hypothetical protein
MPIASKLSSVKASLRLPAFGETTLLAVVACVILCFHVVGGILVSRAMSGPQPGAALEQVTASWSD